VSKVAERCVFRLHCRYITQVCDDFDTEIQDLPRYSVNSTSRAWPRYCSENVWQLDLINRMNKIRPVFLNRCHSILSHQKSNFGVKNSPNSISAGDPAGDAYDAPPDSLVGLGGDASFLYPPPSTPSASRSRRLRRNIG